MTVKELIEELKKHKPDAEVRVPYGDFEEIDADAVYAATAKIGILTSRPKEIDIVVIENSSRGL